MAVGDTVPLDVDVDAVDVEDDWVVDGDDVVVGDGDDVVVAVVLGDDVGELVVVGELVDVVGAGVVLLLWVGEGEDVVDGLVVVDGEGVAVPDVVVVGDGLVEPSAGDAVVESSSSTTGDSPRIVMISSLKVSSCSATSVKV